MEQSRTTCYTTSEFKTGKLARQRRGRNLKTKRQNHFFNRMIFFAIFILFIFLLVIGVIAVIKSLKTETVNAPPKITQTTILPKTEILITTPITTIPHKDTIEDLLVNGILTDDISLSYDLQLVSREASEIFDVPYKLLLAVMFRESSYNPHAANDICYGLMQIHQMNFEWLEKELKEYGVTDIKNNPRDNIYAGAYMLGRLIEKYDDYHKVLMAYNCGESGARKQWDKGYTTSTYSRNVIDTMNELNVSD